MNLAIRISWSDPQSAPGLVFADCIELLLSNQSYGFSSSHMWMWEVDCKESQVQRIDAFELWCWRRHLRVPWTARESNQSMLKEIRSECLLGGLRLRLKLQNFVNLMCRTVSLEMSLMLGKIDGRRRRGWQRMRWLMASLTQWTWVEQAPGVGDGQGGLVCCSPWGRKELDTTEWLNWTELIACPMRLRLKHEFKYCILAINLLDICYRFICI